MEVFTPNTGQTANLLTGEERAELRGKDNYLQLPNGKMAGSISTGGGGSSGGGSGKKTAKKLDKSAKMDIIKLDDIEVGKTVGAKAQNYDIVDPSTGEIFQFAEGTKIQDSQAFAGKGCKKPLKKEVAEGLAEQIGGKLENWQHCKGNGIIDYYGENRSAEVHWFQESSVGKHKFKIKEWKD